MHQTGTITHGELDLFGGRAPQHTISTRCTPMVCTASFHKGHQTSWQDIPVGLHFSTWQREGCASNLHQDAAKNGRSQASRRPSNLELWILWISQRRSLGTSLGRPPVSEFLQC